MYVWSQATSRSTSVPKLNTKQVRCSYTGLCTLQTVPFKGTAEIYSLAIYSHCYHSPKHCPHFMQLLNWQVNPIPTYVHQCSTSYCTNTVYTLHACMHTIPPQYTIYSGVSCTWACRCNTCCSVWPHHMLSCVDVKQQDDRTRTTELVGGVHCYEQVCNSDSLMRFAGDTHSRAVVH